MFAKLKKKLAEEAATAPRSGRIPRSMSKESITSVGADSGDDFASDSSTSRDDLSSQILRRNDQIRKLEAKLSDYAEQLRLMQKTKEKLETALEKHQDSSMRKLQEQNESFQTNRAKMAEGMALALEKKDQEWAEKTVILEQEKASLTARLEQSLTLFQKRDEQDELEVFQIQELAKVKHMLLRKEELLSQRERELKQRGEELNAARLELSHTQDKLYELGEEHEELRAHRDELQGEREEADKRILKLEAREHELQQLIQQVSEDFLKAQSVARSLQRSMDSLQAEHQELKLQHEQHKNKATVMEEERERLLANLQEKAISLERKLEANFSQDEHLQELLKEKSLLEQRLGELRTELLEERTNHTAAVSSLEAQKSSLEQRLVDMKAQLLEEQSNHTTALSSLEAQISKQNTSLSELQTLLRHKDDSFKSYRERTDSQTAELEQRLSDSAQRLKGLEKNLTESEAHREQLRVEWGEERERLQHQVSTQRQRGLEKVAKLEEEMLVLQQERDKEIHEHQDNRRLWEEEKVSMQKNRTEVESTVERLTAELEHTRAELSSRQTVSVEIAKALEETRKQREELQRQVGEMSGSLQKAEQEVCRLTEQVAEKEAELNNLRQDLQAARSSLTSLQAELEDLRLQAEERERERQAQIAEERERESQAQIAALDQEPLSPSDQPDSCSTKAHDLQGEVESLALQLQEAEVSVCEQNGVIAVGDLDQLQKANKELEQQLGEKNKTIKQLQQRLAELKRTLQKELKLKPDTDSDSKDKLQEGRAERPPDKPSAEAPAPALAPTPAPGSTQGLSMAIHSSTRATNSSDLMDMREINFEYLKHVVLKFMSSRETEAYQLIRAVSVLLHFTHEEEDMLKQTLEYKMSWFGSKPAPRGIVRPSVSGATWGWS